MAVARERVCKHTPVARQWLGDLHVIAATVARATKADQLETVLSIGSMPRACKGTVGWSAVDS
jgi:hypothetical protein